MPRTPQWGENSGWTSLRGLRWGTATVRKAFPALSPNFAPETAILFRFCLLENNESKQYFPEESEQLPRKPMAALTHTGRSALPVAISPFSMIAEGHRRHTWGDCLCLSGVGRGRSAHPTSTLIHEVCCSRPWGSVLCDSLMSQMLVLISRF